MVNKKRVSKVLVFVLLIGTLLSSVAFAADTKDYVIDKDIKISAKAHIQSFGDREFETDDKGVLEFGTTGKAKRLEEFALKLEGAPKDMAIEYRVHCQSYGDMPAEADKWIRGAKEIGSRGKAKRIEGIRIRLVNTETGKEYEGYSVEYQVHMQSFGWGVNKTDKGDVWAKDGEFAGTKGLSKRLEAVRVRIKKEDQLKINDVKAIDADKIEVVFNKPVADKVEAELVRGLVPYSTTNIWSKDRKSVVLKSSFNLPEGEYTVKIADLKANVKIENEKAVSLEIKSLAVQKIGDAKVNLVLKNQYDKEMTVSGVTLTAFNATQGKPVTVSGLSLNLADAKVNDVIVVSAVHTSGLTATKNLNVVAQNAESTFKFESIVLPKDQIRILPSDTLYEVKYTLLNQYGEAMKLQTGQPKDGILGGVMFASTDNTVVNPANITVDSNGVLKIKAEKEGTATLTAVVVATGNVSTLTVKVEGLANAKNITVAAPASLVVAKEDVILPYVAVDQYGTQIAPKDLNITINNTDRTKGLSFGTSNATVINVDDFRLGSKNELILKPTGDGVATVYVYLKGVLQNSITFTVEKEAKPVKITAIKDLPTMFEIGSEYDFTNKNVKVVDQYNREIENFAGTINVAAKDGVADKVKFNGNKFSAALEAGSEVFTFSIKDVKGSEFDVTMGTVATKDIVSYELSEVGTIKTGKNKTAKLTGKTADGKVVQLKTEKVTYTTSTNSEVATMDNDLKVTAGGKKGEAVVAAWAGTTKLAEIKVTVSDVPEVAKEVSFDAASYKVKVGASIDLSKKLVVKDQYGDEVTNQTGYWTTSDSSIATVGNDDTSKGNVKGVKAGEVTIGFVTDNGIVATVKVEVE